jgi:hypothetical protein
MSSTTTAVALQCVVVMNPFFLPPPPLTRTAARSRRRRQKARRLPLPPHFGQRCAIFSQINQNMQRGDCFPSLRTQRLQLCCLCQLIHSFQASTAPCSRGLWHLPCKQSPPPPPPPPPPRRRRSSRCFPSTYRRCVQYMDLINAAFPSQIHPFNPCCW